MIRRLEGITVMMVEAAGSFMSRHRGLLESFEVVAGLCMETVSWRLRTIGEEGEGGLEQENRHLRITFD